MSNILYAVDKLTEKMVVEALDTVIIHKKPRTKLKVAFGCIKDFENKTDEERVIAWNENIASYWNKEFNRVTFCSRNEKMLLNMHNRDISIKENDLYIILDMSNIDFVETEVKEDDLDSLISIAKEVIIHNNTLTALTEYEDVEFKVFQQANNLERIEIRHCEFSVDNLNGLFEDCSNLKEVILDDIEIIGLDELSDFGLIGLFGYCHKLKEVDLTTFLKYDEYIEDIDCMFTECESLTKIKGLEKFKFSNVKDTSSAFSDCYKLKRIDLSSAEFKNLTQAYDMFYNCFELEYIDMRNASFSELVRTEGMFKQSTKLKELHIENMGKDTELCFNIIEMFSSLSENCKVYIDNKIKLAYFEMVQSEDEIERVIKPEQSENLMKHKDLFDLHLILTDDYLIEIKNYLRYKSTSEMCYNFGKVLAQTKFILIEATDKEIENFIAKQRLLGETVIYLGNAYISGNEDVERIIIISNTIEITKAFKVGLADAVEDNIELHKNIEFIKHNK